MGVIGAARETNESSVASSSTGEPDERLSIGRSNDRSAHPAHGARQGTRKGERRGGRKSIVDILVVMLRMRLAVRELN